MYVCMYVSGGSAHRGFNAVPDPNTARRHLVRGDAICHPGRFPTSWRTQHSVPASWSHIVPINLSARPCSRLVRSTVYVRSSHGSRSRACRAFLVRVSIADGEIPICSVKASTLHLMPWGPLMRDMRWDPLSCILLAGAKFGGRHRTLDADWQLSTPPRVLANPSGIPRSKEVVVQTHRLCCIVLL